MNKKGATNWLVIVLIVAVAIFVFKSEIFGMGTPAAVAPASGATVTTTGGTTVYATSSVLTLTGYDAKLPGTTPTTQAWIKLSNSPQYTAITSGTTALTPDTTFDLLMVNHTTYHNAVFKDEKAVGTAYTKSYPMKANASLSTFQVISTAFTILSNSDTGAINQTSTETNGEVITLAVKMGGTPNAETQDLRCVLETNDSAKYDMSLTSFNFPGATLEGTSKPGSFTQMVGTSSLKTYLVPSFTDGSIKEGTLTLQAKTAQHLNNTYVKLNCYTKEYFIDGTDGTIHYDIENSQGTIQSLGRFTYQFAIND